MCPLSSLKLGRQRGASLIEFAFVLPFLLMILIGTIYFGYVYVLQSAATHAAQQAAVAAVAVSPVKFGDGYEDEVSDVVAATVFRSLAWLPESINDGVATKDFTCGGNPETDSLTCESAINDSQLTVTVTIGVAGGSSPLLPQISLPIGKVPPDNLSQVSGVAEVSL